MFLGKLLPNVTEVKYSVYFITILNSKCNLLPHSPKEFKYYENLLKFDT